jgi:hypothetical protein
MQASTLPWELRYAFRSPEVLLLRTSGVSRTNEQSRSANCGPATLVISNVG